jgi:lysophospholipid acyltransferase (LPLAT)-like uncharacterized protein
LQVIYRLFDVFKRKVFAYLAEFLVDASDFFKKARKNECFETVLSKLMPIMMRFSYYTTQWTIIGEVFPNSYHSSGKPFIVSLWHDRLMLAPCVWKWRKPLHVLASSHRDGQLIAKVVKHFSMPVVYGSTGKGIAAARSLIRLLRMGEYVAIIPDGPRGPRHKVAPGIVAISKLANADILTYSFCVKRYNTFDSWDKFILVWPFNRGVMVWEKPITAAELKNLSEEEAIGMVEERINSATEKARRVLFNA